LEPRVARVIVVGPFDTGIRRARAKTDRLDARTLARLLAAGALEGLWVPDGAHAGAAAAPCAALAAGQGRARGPRMSCTAL
jgi:hypothetical protein